MLDILGIVQTQLINRENMNLIYDYNHDRK